MADDAPSAIPQSDAVTHAVRTAGRRLLPLLGLAYVINQLDRVNVGFASLTMNADIGLSSTAYGLGAGLFFIGYFVFEVPSNMILHRIGARVWIARIMVSWGIIASATAFVQGPVSFYVVRTLLGIAEAGFVPGIVYYLAQWFPRRQRAKVLSLVFLSPLIASIVGGPASTALIQYTDGLLGFAREGWRFMFLVEGLPAIVVGILVLVVLPNRPRDARWLGQDEAAALEEAIRVEDTSKSGHDASLRSVLFDPRVLLLAVVYFGIVFSFYVINFFLPQIIEGFEEDFGVRYSFLQVGLISAVPFALAAVAMLLWSRLVNRNGAWGWSISGPALVAAAAIGTALYMNSPLIVMAFVSIAAMAIFAMLPVFWQIPSTLLAGAGAAAGIAFINAVSNLGGFGGPYVIGWLKDASGSFQPGLWLVALLLVVSGTVAFRFRRATGDSPSPPPRSDARMTSPAP